MSALLYKLIGRNVILGFVAMVLLLLLLAGLSIYQLYSIHEKSEQLRENYAQIHSDLHAIRAGVGNLRRFEKDTFLNASDSDVYRQYFQRWQKLLKKVRDDLSHLDSIADKPRVLGSVVPSFRQGLEFYASGFETVYLQLESGELRSPEDGNQAILPFKQYVRQIDASLLEAGKYIEDSERDLHFKLIAWRDKSVYFVVSLSGIIIVIAALITSTVFNATSRVAEELNYRATHDPLTSLLNRSGFKNEVSSRLASAEKGKLTALLYLDLDQFKVINDVCGHMAGDEMLKQLSFAFSEKLDSRVVVARMGGDEFSLFTDSTDESHFTELANRILRSIREFRFVWESRIFTVSGSIGIKVLNEQDFSFENALNLADAACFIAKDRGRNQVYVLEGDDTSVRSMKDQMDWAARITQLIEQDKLTLYYQQINNLQHAEGVSSNHCEVLLRVLDEQGQASLPANFIPAAERFSLMQHIDRWVVTHTLKDIAEGGTLSGFSSVSINLSGESLSDKSFAVFLLSELERFKIPGSRVCFEITETAAIGSFDNARKMISILGGHGCRFALDDFGTGLSSFGYIKKLPVNFLKIDGLFIRNLLSDSVDVTLVSSLVAIARSLGVSTVAECVEDSDTAVQLTQMGVDFAQGYHFHRPQPVSPNV